MAVEWFIGNILGLPLELCRFEATINNLEDMQVWLTEEGAKAGNLGGDGTYLSGVGQMLRAYC
jgi:hypothetical protein